MANDVIKINCPQCQQALGFKRPEKGNEANLTCPKCGKKIKVQIQEKPIQMAGQEPDTGQMRMARLVVVEGPQRDKQAYTLRVGSNIIGRSDTDTVQDIAISGDMTISRRSVDLTVGISSGKYSYMLKVLNAKNLVYVNNTPLHTGETIALYPGDIVLMGCTKLKLYV